MFAPWVGKIPWRRKWQSTPVFLPRELHGQRSLAGYSPWGHKRVKHDLVTKQQPQQQHCLVIKPTGSQAEFVSGAQSVFSFFFKYLFTSLAALGPDCGMQTLRYIIWNLPSQHMDSLSSCGIWALALTGSAPAICAICGIILFVMQTKKRGQPENGAGDARRRMGVFTNKDNAVILGRRCGKSNSTRGDS